LKTVLIADLEHGKLNMYCMLLALTEFTCRTNLCFKCNIEYIFPVCKLFWRRI